MWNEKEGEKLIERQIQRLTDVITWEQYCLWGDTLFRTQIILIFWIINMRTCSWTYEWLGCVACSLRNVKITESDNGKIEEWQYSIKKTLY